MTDLTPELPDVGDATSWLDYTRELRAALDAERARADKAVRELEISQKVADDLFDLERAAEARNRNLEAVAEAARNAKVQAQREQKKTHGEGYTFWQGYEEACDLILDQLSGWCAPRLDANEDTE